MNTSLSRSQLPAAALLMLWGSAITPAAPIFNAPTLTPMSGCGTLTSPVITGTGGPTMQAQAVVRCPPAGVVQNGPFGGLMALYGGNGFTLSGTGSGTFDTGFFPVGFSGNGPLGPLTATFQINGTTVASGGPGFFEISNQLAGQVLSTWQVTLTGASGAIPVGPFQQPPPNDSVSCVWFGSNTLCNNSAAGSSQTNPILPNSPVPVGGSGGSGGGNPPPPTWGFRNGPSGGTFDPPFVNGFEYVGVGGTRFDRIVLPTGFGSSFTVWTGAGFATSLGTFAAGAAVDFVLGGVDSFQIRDIQPSVDAALPNAFPLTIFFEGGGLGSFDQTGIENVATGVPEPSTWLLMAVALPLALRRCRRS